MSAARLAALFKTAAREAIRPVTCGEAERRIAVGAFSELAPTARLDSTERAVVRNQYKTMEILNEYEFLTSQACSLELFFCLGLV
eukprot:COSAG02_NODE_7637_length_2922_cov_6.155863_1_plen_85_part_00